MREIEKSTDMKGLDILQQLVIANLDDWSSVASSVIPLVLKHGP